MSYELPWAKWTKSSYSGPANECVEVAWLDDTSVGVRDSKDPAGPVLAFSRAEWATFTAGVRNGRPASA
ncbi:DUF397 domain-containing protein [Nocardia sp. NPDC058499]|uniref:DUF397 domain-containing protein n=1 Tax=Nocardia sp. NPDC058499 TaxID=3346530 RepID=UPI003660B80D